MEQMDDVHYHKVLPLFDFDFPNRTLLLACLHRQMPGIVFVDHPTTPTACLVVTNFHAWTFLGGNPGQDWLHRAIAQLRQSRPLTLLWATWTHLGALPPPDSTETINRYEFLDLSLSLHAQEPVERLAPGYSFRKIDQALLSRCEWRNEMLLAYGTPENFLKHGLGMCLMHEDEICCEAYAVFHAGHRCELGVVTPEAHRRRGYAAMTCAALLKKCAELGWQPNWSCHQENTASIATARRLGYQTQREYQLLYYAPNVQ